ncbi:hypothetical protein Huta_0134 [Halorhabdus utahensis DSM 12940]|uniref:Uncharacterized protein n=1 Tax=Halorhabdus utahensis (strain DSM 12940 / JCM 11049 / AX-2) TaxID=519442 RepID=C7NP31_HALUD|nr:hypothetical protein [Halorhabdus utahensis]ACV10322.1 hypothetical protein Huta_0134 [Halorhabdus utahensis DSM 12940]
MSIPAQKQSLRTRVFGTEWQPIVVGFAIMALTAVVGASIGRMDVAVLSPAAGGLAGGFQYGKNTFDAAAVGFRIGFTLAALAWVGSFVFILFFYFLYSSGVEWGDTVTTLNNYIGLFSFRGLGYVPLSGLLGIVGSAIGTNIRRIFVPHEYNPPLY